MSVTPDFVGQIYKDTVTGNLWRANSTTPGDWTFEAGPTVINQSTIGFFTYADSPGTNFTYSGTSIVPGIDFEYNTILEIFSAPNLVSIDPTDLQGGYVFITDCTSLTSIDFSSLVYVQGNVEIQNCTLLTSIDLSSFLPKDGAHDLNFSGNALDASTVNLILARCVANSNYTGPLNLSGGTNAAPTGQGIVDKATILARPGGVVTTN